MEGNTTIEEKPATLYLHTIQPSSQASTPHLPDQMGFPGLYTMAPPGMYGYPHTGPMSMPMWGYPSGMPLPGQYFRTQLPMMNSQATMAPTTATQTMAESTSRNTITSNSNVTPVIIPDIVAWFAYLDKHKERHKDGIMFSPYGDIRKRISSYQSTHFGVHSLKRFAGLAWDRSRYCYFNYAVCQGKFQGSEVRKMGLSWIVPVSSCLECCYQNPSIYVVHIE